MLDKKLVLMLYENNQGYSQIAKRFNVSRQRIHQIVKNYKYHGRNGRLNRYKKLGNTCEICKKTAIVLHHIDKNNTNDIFSNLMPLCKDCHYEIHRGEMRIYPGRTKKIKPKRLYLWSLKYKECIICLKTDLKHAGNGLCSRCYTRKYYLEVRLSQ